MPKNNNNTIIPNQVYFSNHYTPEQLAEFKRRYAEVNAMDSVNVENNGNQQSRDSNQRKRRKDFTS